METFDFIKKYNILYDKTIDYTLLDEYNNSYFYYKILSNKLINDMNYLKYLNNLDCLKYNNINEQKIIYTNNNNEIIFNKNFKNNFIIISINENNDVKIKYLLKKPKHNIIYFLYNKEQYIKTKSKSIRSLLTYFNAIIEIINNEMYKRNIKKDIIKYIKSLDDNHIINNINNKYDYIYYYYKDKLTEFNNDLEDFIGYNYINTQYNNNELIINIYGEYQYYRTLHKCFKNIIIKSNNNIQNIKIIHNYCNYRYHDSIDTFINVYIDYMPNLKTIDMEKCIITMNKLNNLDKITFGNIKDLNNYFMLDNLLNLKSIKYIMPLHYEVNGEDIPLFDNTKINKLYDFIKFKHLEYIYFNNSSIEINISFNKFIECNNTELLFTNNIDINKLLLKGWSVLKTSNNNYNIKHLILYLNIFCVNVENDYNNNINCLKIDLYIESDFNNWGSNYGKNKILKRIEYNLNHLNSNDITIWFENEYDLNLCKNDILNLNQNIKFNLIKN